MILSSKQACQSNNDKENPDANKGRYPLWGGGGGGVLTPFKIT